MRLSNFINSHKFSLLSLALVVIAAVLGADSAFAMAVVDPVEPAGPENPSEHIEDRHDENGNPVEQPQADEQGLRTQQPGRASTRTDLRDMRLLSEDYDKTVDQFRRFRFPEETLFMSLCTPVKVKDYVHKHGLVGSTDLDVVYKGETVIEIGNKDFTAAGISYNHKTRILTMDSSLFDNVNQFMPFGTATIENTVGYEKVDDAWVPNGELGLFIEKHEVDGDKVQFYVINASQVDGLKTLIRPGMSIFHVMAPACSESQIHVNSDAFNPVPAECYLQKKIGTAVVNDSYDEADPKYDFKTKNVLASAEENFKRKCARSHWNGVKFRRQVFVKETGNREDVFGEKGILRQIPMMYTHGSELQDNDLLAIGTLMFGINASTDHAYVFCGMKALTRLIKLVNSNPKYKDIGKVEVNDYGVKVRRWEDNFGTQEFIWAQILDDLGYSEYMVYLDLEHAERPYMLNDKKTTRDMSVTGEAREAKEHNLVRIDCIDLKGHNAVLVCPTSEAAKAQKLSGATGFASWTESTLPTDKTQNYYLVNDCEQFAAGEVITWDVKKDGWVLYEGQIEF